MDNIVLFHRIVRCSTEDAKLADNLARQRGKPALEISPTLKTFTNKIREKAEEDWKTAFKHNNEKGGAELRQWYPDGPNSDSLSLLYNTKRVYSKIVQLQTGFNNLNAHTRRIQISKLRTAHSKWERRPHTTTHLLRKEEELTENTSRIKALTHCRLCGAEEENGTHLATECTHTRPHQIHKLNNKIYWTTRNIEQSVQDTQIEFLLTSQPTKTGIG